MTWWYENEEEEMKWHFVDKELPTEWGFYLVAISVTEGLGAFVTVMDYSPSANEWTDSTGHKEYHVFAWMPLPNPPKKEE